MVNTAGGEPACPPRRQVNANVVIGTTPYSPAVSTLTPVKWPVAATSSRRSLLRRASKAVRMSRAVRPAVVRQPPSMSSWRRRCESARSVVVCPGWPLSAQQLTHAPMHVIFSRSPGSGRRTSPLLLPHNVLSRSSPRLVHGERLRWNGSAWRKHSRGNLPTRATLIGPCSRVDRSDVGVVECEPGDESVWRGPAGPAMLGSTRRRHLAGHLGQRLHRVLGVDRREAPLVGWLNSHTTSRLPDLVTRSNLVTDDSLELAPGEVRAPLAFLPLIICSN